MFRGPNCNGTLGFPSMSLSRACSTLFVEFPLSIPLSRFPLRSDRAPTECLAHFICRKVWYFCVLRLTRELVMDCPKIGMKIDYSLLLDSKTAHADQTFLFLWVLMAWLILSISVDWNLIRFSPGGGRGVTYFHISATKGMWTAPQKLSCSS